MIQNHFESYLIKINLHAEKALLQENDLVKIINFVSDVNMLRDEIPFSYASDLFLDIEDEINHSISYILSGNYRYAFTSLRLCLEKAFAQIHFSTDLIAYEEWKRMERDISWKMLNDSENGILSAKYSKSFFPELSVECILNKEIANRLYRSLSEYVHGNINTISSKPKMGEFSKILFDAWLEKMEIFKSLYIFLICLRYFRDFKTFKNKESREIIKEYLGHINSIRDKLVSIKDLDD